MRDGRPEIVLNMAVRSINGREADTLISSYTESVWRAGGVPLLLPAKEDAEFIRSYVSRADGAVLIGGKDYPPSYYGEAPHPETGLNRLHPHFDLDYFQCVCESGIPFLGICAGCQLMNIAAGGKLIQHLPNADEAHRNGLMHEARITGPGWFSRALSLAPGARITVNSFHHQAADPEHLGTELRITALAFDGTVEALEMAGDVMRLGVQFHPERLEKTGPLFFQMLVEEARKWHKKIQKTTGEIRYDHHHSSRL